MRYHKHLTKNYELTEKDTENINSLKETMMKFKDEFVSDFKERLINKFNLPDKAIREIEGSHDLYAGEWYERFFEAKVNNEYLSFLFKIGSTHIQHKIEQEWANSMMSFVRLWLHEKIFQSVDDDVHRKGILLSVHKLMDINYDVISHSYFEKEMSKYTVMFSLKNMVVDISEKFSFFMHMILLAVLMLLTIASVGMFTGEVYNLFSSESGNYSLISALGSLLIIWVLVELVHTEIQIIKGGKFKISIFVGVALIAFIRDLLIITLKHEGKSEIYIFVLSAILILGFVYWLTVRTERQ